MVTTERRTENDLTPLVRLQIKKNGIVLRLIRSASGHDYCVTLFENKPSSCKRTDGTWCPGWRFRQSCHHTQLAMQLEEERSKQAAIVAAQAIKESPPLETSQKGQINGSSSGFNFLK